MSRAENVTGLKHNTEDRNFILIYKVVEKYSVRIEAVSARSCGVYRSKNVGISSMKFCENQNHRKSEVSWAMTINPGLGGPNRVTETGNVGWKNRLIFLSFLKFFYR